MNLYCKCGNISNRGDGCCAECADAASEALGSKVIEFDGRITSVWKVSTEHQDMGPAGLALKRLKTILHKANGECFKFEKYYNLPGPTFDDVVNYYQELVNFLETISPDFSEKSETEGGNGHIDPFTIQQG